MPLKLILNIDHPIFAMKTSQFSTPQYYAIVFSSDILCSAKGIMLPT